MASLIYRSCLPQSCEVYLVQPGDTCWSIANTYGLTFSLFSGYNPTINSQCTNLLSGVNVCLSPAAGTYTPTTIAGATVTQTGVYATATITPTSPTPFGTTSQCGRYYEAQSGDYCQQISLNNSISVSPCSRRSTRPSTQIVRILIQDSTTASFLRRIGM